MGSSALGDKGEVDEIGDVVIMIIVMKRIGGLAMRRCMMKGEMEGNA